MARTDEMAEFEAALGIYVTQSIAIHRGNCGVSVLGNS